jgi:SAM-dependent methyltransferase
MTPVDTERHPGGATAAAGAEGNGFQPSGWTPYWEALGNRQQLYREQAGEYVRNLTAAVPLDGRMQVLDFGCGFGLVAERVAPRVGVLYLWDASPNMRRHARVNVAGRPNVRFLDSLERGSLDGLPHFDLVLVNSVVQYMTPEAFSAWLGSWRELLAPSGRIVISDVIPRRGGSLVEFLDLLKFSVRRRFLLRAVWQALGELGPYRKTRRAFPLTRMDADELRQRGEAANLTVTVLPRNLTHFPRRITAVFTAVVPPESGILR